MKKSLIILNSILVLSVISCKKSTESGNKSVLKSNDNGAVLADNGEIDSTIHYETDVNGKKYLKTDYVYKATDGSLVKVVFNYEEKTMSVRSNNKTFILNKVEAKGNETTYEKMDMKATVKGDSLILDQGNNIIELVKTKI
ncbi:MULTISPECIES: hypothetical protein [Chryseobacterium]|jgi:hypothetical protein|uniref:NlpE-like protein n=1 Tax=Chryseobacterium geocarposphaerae TaxID=1416776 RepID=A0ABU1LF65_9FLAO|nr:MULTISPECIES: hypothetical protein [Chryseobacterium]ALR31724.1 hypothetical protein ATE47_14925 [Chryseobacterium sp. IHB B 17019]MDR6405245.1 hypothetical protein [Chryseobacterium geocarposphaerae]MDR6697404.1 hypothetical protein [Chryseobacterium ginsenosidimutans]